MTINNSKKLINKPFFVYIKYVAKLPHIQKIYI